MSGLDSLFDIAPAPPLETGDSPPFFYGVAVDGQFYSFMNQAGRPLALILAPDLNDPRLPELIDAFLGLKDAFDIIGADVMLTACAAPNDVYIFAQNYTDRLKIIACEASVYSRCGFSRYGLSALGFDRNCRVAARIGAGSAGEIAAGVFSALGALPRDEAQALIMQPAPVMVLPNLLPPELCRSLIERFENEGHFDSGFAGADATGEPVYKLDYAKKKRQDLLIHEGHDLYPILTDALLRRCGPEIKKAFHIEIAHFDRILVARYDVGGHFARHRDNGGANVAFRQFALSVNLNAGEYEGGALSFPEFNDSLYAPPTGGGLIFSGTLIHEAQPVTRGSRYVLLTFLHDAAAEARRLAYEAKTGTG